MNIFSDEFNSLLENLIKQTIKETIQASVKEIIDEKKPKHKEKLTLTIDEASKLSGIGRTKLSELIYKENTDFPYFKVGSKYLINRDMLLEWLEKITKEGRIL